MATKSEQEDEMRPPKGCDGFKVWKTDGDKRYMRCACGGTATATSFVSEALNRREHYKVMRLMAGGDGTDGERD